MANILGLSFDYHDSAAALLVDGHLVAAIHEERLTRIKHDPSLPQRSVAFCLQQAGINAQQLDAVVFYENPLRKFDRILKTSQHHSPGYLKETLQAWIAEGKFSPRQRIANLLGIDPGKIHYREHHRSHAASAFFASTFDKAAVVTVDGVGEYETATIWKGQGTTLEKIRHADFPASLGLFYSAMTAYLGFEVNEGEYKVMGMASYGMPIHTDVLRDIYRRTALGLPELNPAFFDLLTAGEYPFTPRLTKLLGPNRPPEAPFSPMDDPEAQRHADIAASVQALTEEIYLDLCQQALDETGATALCIAGGVALNSKANRRLQDEFPVPIFIQPAAGDAGGALGAALDWHFATAKTPVTRPTFVAYQGRRFDNETIVHTLDSAGVEGYRQLNDDELYAEIATQLAQGKVVGWLNGRSEWGPRSLGARSILADPRRAEMKEIVNSRIKFRELFRPFAPSALAEMAHEYFELPSNLPAATPEDFMLSVARATPTAHQRIPAVVHVDGTSRVQLVRAETAPRFHGLISAFYRQTGVPVLLNTSFNRRGEPIVDSPIDALNTFMWTDIDILVLENIVINKGTACL